MERTELSSDPMQPGSPAEPTATAPEPPPLRPWPAVFALVTSWCRPATTTARRAGVWMPSVFVVHWIAVLLGVAATVMSVAWYQYRVAQAPTTLGDELLEAALGAVGEVIDSPQVRIAAAVFAVAIELISLAVALAMAPFGARDERLRDSLRHAVRRTWLQTPHAAVALLAASVLIAELAAGHDCWRRALVAQYVLDHPEPTPPENSGDAEAMKAYQAAASAHFQRQWEYANEQTHPWYRVHGEELSFLIVIAAAGWLTWGLFRAAAAPRPVPRLVHDQLCRTCGYDLNGQPADGRCSECGAAVSDTLGPQAVHGPPWVHRACAGRLHTYLQTLAGSLRRPTELARKISIESPREHALRYMAINALLGAVGFSAATCAAEYLKILSGTVAYYGYRTVEWQLLSSFVLELVVALVLFTAFASGAALLTALVVRVRDGRSVLGWIGQWVAYGSGSLALFFVLSGVWNVFLALGADILLALGVLSGLPAYTLIFGAWLLPNAVMAVGYLVHTARGVRGVRYAWR